MGAPRPNPSRRSRAPQLSSSNGRKNLFGAQKIKFIRGLDLWEFCTFLQTIVMLIFHDPQCADYGSSLRPEQPARVTRSVSQLRAAHPDWEWRVPTAAADETLLLAHTAAHLKRLRQPSDFDSDTPFFPQIEDHARRSVGSAVLAAEYAMTSGRPVFSLMRPPGHHATAAQAMGFCYLNSIAVATLYAQTHLGAQRVAVWDFDAHHGNGTE